MAIGSHHIILGAGGAIAQSLTDALRGEVASVVWASRTGRAAPGVSAIRMDLMDARQTADAIEPGATVYLLAGIKYRTSAWHEQWPKIMDHVLRACEEKAARLVFFDNVYMYGKVDGVMTEETPIRPYSRKGEVRAKIAEDLLSAARAGSVRGLIARSADFYGPGADATSTPGLMVFGRLVRGKRAQWPANADRTHSFTYTADCGKALMQLAAADDAYGQVWHMPTAGSPLTGRQFVAHAARAMGCEDGVVVLKRWMAQLAGLVIPDVREMVEMLYQYEYDYVFSSAKFERRFGCAATSYAQGIEEMASSLRRA